MGSCFSVEREMIRYKENANSRGIRTYRDSPKDVYKKTSKERQTINSIDPKQIIFLSTP